MREAHESQVDQSEAAAQVLAGGAVLYPLLAGFVGPFVLRTAVVLGLPDIIARAGPDETLTVKQIAAQIKSESVSEFELQRVLTALVNCKVFGCTQVESEMQYGLTPASQLLVTENNPQNQAAAVLFQTDQATTAPWYHLHRCVLYGEEAFQAAHGKDMWKYANDNPEYSKCLNAAMTSHTTLQVMVAVKKYEGFKHMKTLMDVGGGVGKALETIISSYPHIHGINYDLPHVVADAPTMPGIEHVGGSMFESVPSGDAIFMKHIMHDWKDDNCLQILNNCQRALPDNGKVLIYDFVVEPSGGLAQMLDMVMMAHNGGMERTEDQWRNLLTTAGFSTINFISILPEQCLIEAVK